MIGAGIPNPLMLLNGGDPLDELGKIDKSLRLRASATAFVSRTPAVASNQTTWTFSAWVKRGSFGNSMIFEGDYPDSGNQTHGPTYFRFNASDQLELVHYQDLVGDQYYKTSSAVFRDTAAHVHVVAVFDTSNATAADRLRIYANGQRITSFARSSDPTLNYAGHVNLARPHHIGKDAGLNLGSPSAYYDGYLSHVAFVDGQALDPSYFGQFHPRTGQWRPKSRAAVKAVVDAGGVNSFFLPFDDATSLATLTGDASAKGNNWTANNISLTAGVNYDSMLDTPTFNLPIIDPTYAIYGTVAGTISDGGLKFASSSTYHFTPCTIPLPSYGKWQAEFIPQDTVSLVGLADLDNFAGASQNLAGGYGWYGSILYTGNAVAAQSGLATMAANDIVTVTADMDALSMKIFKNGTLVCTQALTAGKRYAFACGDYYAPGGTSCYANFGQRAFGYPQTGFKALSTKNLPYPAVAKSESAFVARTDTGANIVATLSAAATFANWIRIYKRRDAAEGWRWQFSDDAANYMDSSSTAAKAAFPALSGTSYVGYALRVAAANGVATGRLTHTNGVADVVTDGLANARKAVILVNEAGGNWFFYHPDLTAGALLYLNLNNVETTDASISSVTATGFTAAAALPSGTYRWIALAECDGFLKLSKHIGNGSADGPRDYAGFRPAFSMFKCTNNANAMLNYDNARDQYNAESAYLLPASNSLEYVGSGSTDVHDFVSSGMKGRASNTGINTSGNTYVNLMIAAFPFRYANAR